MNPEPQPEPDNQPLRVMTFNILHGAASGLDLSRIAAVITEADADVVGLQEVDDATERAQGHHQAAELAALTGLEHFYFGPAFAFQGGYYGGAILSRYPLSDPRVVHLDDHTEQVGELEPRIAILAEVDVDGESVTFGTLHASLDPTERAATGPIVLAEIDDPSRAIIVGDFNEAPGESIGASIAGAGMADAWAELHPTAPGYTQPALAPRNRIDFIFRGAALGATTAAWVPNTIASDHRPVVAVIPIGG